MNGNVMYDMARLRMADQQRIAGQRRMGRQAVRARRQARAVRRPDDRGVRAAPEPASAPVNAAQLCATARAGVPAQRREAVSRR